MGPGVRSRQKEQLGKPTLRNLPSPPPSLTGRPSLSGPTWDEEEGPTVLSHGRLVSLPQGPTAPSPQVSCRCEPEPRLVHPVH